MMERFEGKLVRLRPYRDGDLEYFAGLRNDMRTQGWNQRMPPRATTENTRERLEDRQRSQHSAVLAIETLEGQLVGYVTYEEGPIRLKAMLGAITGPEHWGKGYAREAQELVLRFLFEDRGVQVVNLWTTSWNEKAMRGAEKLGFKLGARLREATVMDGKCFDAIIMDMTREEYYSKRGLADPLPGL
jgi:RimJ/RimL family protein N-acetyltransferase